MSTFRAEYDRKVDQWRDRLAEMGRSGRRVVVWGAGSKGVTFLNVLGAADVIECVIDINPRKHGHFAPGSGHRILPSQFLRGRGLQLIIVMNANYATEIRSHAALLGIGIDTAPA